MLTRKNIIFLAALSMLLPGASGIARADEASPCAEGGGVLIRDWTVDGVPGTKGRPARATIECLADGRIRHVVEVSKDKGETWSTLFESVYTPAEAASVMAKAAPTEPVKAPVATAVSKPVEDSAQSTPAPPTTAVPPATTSPPAAQPSPTPSSAQEEHAPAQHQAARQTQVEGSEVQAISRELQREEIPEEEAPELVMASPMILEVIPGEVDSYPEGSVWSTDETAGFICNSVIIKKVMVGRRAKGGSVDLIVRLNLFTARRQRNVDILLEAFIDGEVVASEELRKVRLGLNIPAHGKKGMEVETIMSIPQETFDRIFADGAQRKMRVTLTSPAA